MGADDTVTATKRKGEPRLDCRRLEPMPSATVAFRVPDLLQEVGVRVKIQRFFIGNCSACGAAEHFSLPLRGLALRAFVAWPQHAAAAFRLLCLIQTLCLLLRFGPSEIRVGYRLQPPFFLGRKAGFLILRLAGGGSLRHAMRRNTVGWLTMGPPSLFTD